MHSDITIITAFKSSVICAESIALYTFMGQLFAYLAPTAAVATVLGGVNHFLWNIFNGFLVPSPLMAAGWRWLNYISATTYVIYSLAASQLGDNKKKIALPGFSGALSIRIFFCSQCMIVYVVIAHDWSLLILPAAKTRTISHHSTAGF